MAEYAFGPDEYVVLKASEVQRGERATFSMPRPSELILTNQNIILPKKGLTGKVKSYEVYPLADIRMVDGVPQCRMDTSEFMEVKLEISFKNELVSFAFQSLENKKEVREWVNAISNILTGHDAPEEKVRANGVGALTDGDEIADAFGRIFGSFNNAFDKKRAQAAPVVAYRCPSCNASLKGKVGETIVCPYCGSNVTIEQTE